MNLHIELGETVEERRKCLANLIRFRKVTLGGHKKMKIYGLLSCKSGKRMKLENRIFFEKEQEAIQAGYRPCGACMSAKYKKWKANELLEMN